MTTDFTRSRLLSFPLIVMLAQLTLNGLGLPSVTVSTYLGLPPPQVSP